jgi:hypothetical protein
MRLLNSTESMSLLRGATMTACGIPSRTASQVSAMLRVTCTGTPRAARPSASPGAASARCRAIKVRGPLMDES